MKQWDGKDISVLPELIRKNSRITRGRDPGPAGNPSAENSTPELQQGPVGNERVQERLSLGETTDRHRWAFTSVRPLKRRFKTDI